MHSETSINSAHPLLTTKEAAAYLGVSTSFLEHGRSHGEGPSYVIWWKGGIRYRREDLDAWMPGGRKENLIRKEAAEYLGRSRRWMEDAACNGYGPKYVTYGKGFLRYALAELIDYMQTHPLEARTKHAPESSQLQMPADS